MLNIKYSQNFYRNSKKLKQILERIGLSKKDVVLDIGAGRGVLTKELVKYSDHVIAYELDDRLFKILKEDFSNTNVDIRNKDFLKEELPNSLFWVFSNIPFSLTSAVIAKITEESSLLEGAYLFVQKESAERYIGNTQISAILNFRYKLDVVERFNSRDFFPIPNVNVVLLRIEKREDPGSEYLLFRDFVTYIFNQPNVNVLKTFRKIFTEKQMEYISRDIRTHGYTRPSDIPKDYYISIFKYFETNGVKYMKKVKGYCDKYNKKHSKREKIFRTRKVIPVHQ